MMLFLESQPDVFEKWIGQPVNGVRYPLSISSWPDADLDAIGLYRPQPADPIPDGKIAISSTVKRVDGVVKWVHELEDAPPPQVHYEPLSSRQIRLGLIQAGISLDDVATAINDISDQQHREIAQVEWEYASQFERDHHLIDQIGSSMGLTKEQIDSMWLGALEL